MNVPAAPAKFEVSSLSVPEITGGNLKHWAVPGYAHAPFAPKFLMGVCSDGLCECIRPNLKSVALPVPEIIAGT